MLHTREIAEAVSRRANVDYKHTLTEALPATGSTMHFIVPE